MFGLGDNAYQRNVVAALRQQDEVAVITPWPELYGDLGVRFIKPETELRTQAENITRLRPDLWWTGRVDKTVSLSYGIADFQAGLSIPHALARKANVDIRHVPFDPPKVPLLATVPDRPIGIVHPPTLRSEWYNAARPCRSRYLQLVIDAHPELFWIEVGWNSPQKEWLYDDQLRVDLSLMNGELYIAQLLTLWKRAKLVVSSVGFPLPLGQVLGTPTLILYGGDIPDKLLSPGLPTDCYRAIEPDPFCACYAARHRRDECNKSLNDGAVLAAAEELLGLAR
jgi:hypothetical protein